jgi:23S rRNA (uracil1939-C5)-methyltransferase
VEGVASLLLYDASREKFELFGPGFLTWRSGGREFRVGHLSFFQANRFLVEELALTATEAAAGDLALDLYAGVGLFSAALAKKFARVVAVESNEAAARDLQHNLAGLDERARAVHGDVAAVLKNWREQPSLVLLDPPRTGVESAALERVAALAAPELRYVSCDPATLARDLAALHNAGYALRALHLFDLFPQTFHIETLAILRRGS